MLYTVLTLPERIPMDPPSLPGHQVMVERSGSPGFILGGWIFPRKIAFFGPEKLVYLGKYEWISEGFPLVCFMFWLGVPAFIDVRLFGNHCSGKSMSSQHKSPRHDVKWLQWCSVDGTSTSNTHKANLGWKLCRHCPELSHWNDCFQMTVQETNMLVKVFRAPLF